MNGTSRSVWEISKKNKRNNDGYWSDGSTVKSTYHSGRGPKFGS